MTHFRDRSHAGKVLVQRLFEFRDQRDTLLLALPRGGVPVASEIARHLNIPLDLLIVRKLGVPGHEELAMGALAAGGVCVLDERLIESLQLPKDKVDAVIALEQKELERRNLKYRQSKAAVNVDGKTVIIVDDGIATGATMRAAIATLRAQHPKKIIVAVPVAAKSTVTKLKLEADEVICAIEPANFEAVGAWYLDFQQTSDEEVEHLMQWVRPHEKSGYFFSSILKSKSS